MKKSILKVVSIVLCFALLFGSSISSGAASADDFSRVTCVVNGDAATQRGFSWFTTTECATKIQIYNILGMNVTDDLKIETSCDAFEGNYSHKAVVSGLEAGRTYSYVVGDGVNWSDRGFFTTDDGDDDVKFIVAGDVQASNPDNFAKAQKVIERAYFMMPDADFYSLLGDYTNDSTNEEWDMYADAFDAINMKATHVPVAGNHDSTSGWFNQIFALDTSESTQTKSGVNYSFDYGNVHFAVLNSNDTITVSNAQLTWLKNDMNSTDADWKIVLLHKSPYSLGKDIKWPDATYLQDALGKVCDETNVDLVMSGHDHMYVRTQPLNGGKAVAQADGTTYVLAGTAGSKRYDFRTFIFNNYFDGALLNTAVAQSNGDYLADGSLANNNPDYVGGIFNTVEVDGGELKLTSYVLSDDGEKMTVIDEFEIEKEQGENEITFTGDNTTSAASSFVDQLASFFSLAVYAFTKWLPMFFKTLPDLLATYAATGTF